MLAPLLEVGGALELRASGRTLRAELRYGDRARDRAEQFAAGSIRPVYPVTMNIQHDPMHQIATTEDRSLRMMDTDTALIVEADLQGAALDLVARGRLTAISPEFYARRERRDAGVRILQEADLPAWGLVDVGSYKTPIELRAMAGTWLRATIPTGHRCSCECAGAGCNSVIFDAGSLDVLIDGTLDVIATTGRLVPENILGSKTAGTLLLERTDDGVALGLTEPLTPAAASVRAAAAVSVIHARPLVDIDASESVLEGETRRYSRAVVGTILVKTAPVDRREGWDPAEVDGADAEARARRRLWL